MENHGDPDPLEIIPSRIGCQGWASHHQYTFGAFFIIKVLTCPVGAHEMDNAWPSLDSKKDNHNLNISSIRDKLHIITNVFEVLCLPNRRLNIGLIQ